MNDPHAPVIVEWFYRIAAVLGMCVVFVLIVLMIAQIEGIKTSSPQIERRSQVTEK